jgi:hypothetical protein
MGDLTGGEISMSDLIPSLAPWGGRVLVAVVFLVGMAIAWRGLLRRRLPSPHCRKCSYNLTGLPSLRCPECGWIARNSAAAQRGPRRWRLVLLGMMLAASLPIFVFAKRTKQFGWAYYRTFGPGHFFFGSYTIDRLDVGRASVRILGNRSPVVYTKRVEIHHRGRRVPIVIENYLVALACIESIDSKSRCNDITGDGLPNIIIRSDHTGNGACCTEWTVLSIDDRGVRVLAQIQADRDSSFEDLDGDGVYEFIQTDSTFAYAWAGRWIPYPTLFHRFANGAYAPAIDLMRSATPDLADLDAKRDAFVKHRGNWENATPRSRFAALLHIVLDLIYAGHSAIALDYARTHWPNELPFAFDDFAEELRRDLLPHCYWEALADLNDHSWLFTPPVTSQGTANERSTMLPPQGRGRLHEQFWRDW